MIRILECLRKGHLLFQKKFTLALGKHLFHSTVYLGYFLKFGPDYKTILFVLVIPGILLENKSGNKIIRSDLFV